MTPAGSAAPPARCLTAFIHVVASVSRSACPAPANMASTAAGLPPMNSTTSAPGAPRKFAMASARRHDLRLRCHIRGARRLARRAGDLRLSVAPSSLPNASTASTADCGAPLARSDSSQLASWRSRPTATPYVGGALPVNGATTVANSARCAGVAPLALTASSAARAVPATVSTGTMRSSTTPRCAWNNGATAVRRYCPPRAANCTAVSAVLLSVWRAARIGSSTPSDCGDRRELAAEPSGGRLDGGDDALRKRVGGRGERAGLGALRERLPERLAAREPGGRLGDAGADARAERLGPTTATRAAASGSNAVGADRAGDSARGRRKAPPRRRRRGRRRRHMLARRRHGGRPGPRRRGPAPGRPARSSRRRLGHHESPAGQHLHLVGRERRGVIAVRCSRPPSACARCSPFDTAWRHGGAGRGPVAHDVGQFRRERRLAGRRALLRQSRSTRRYTSWRLLARRQVLARRPLGELHAERVAELLQALLKLMALCSSPVGKSGVSTASSCFGSASPRGQECGITARASCGSSDRRGRIPEAFGVLLHGAHAEREIGLAVLGVGNFS